MGCAVGGVGRKLLYSPRQEITIERKKKVATSHPSALNQEGCDGEVLG